VQLLDSADVRATVATLRHDGDGRTDDSDALHSEQAEVGALGKSQLSTAGAEPDAD